MEGGNRPATGYPAPNQQPNGYSANPPPAGTAYPYMVAPPPNGHYYQHNNAYYPQNYYDAHAARRATVLRRIVAFIIGLVIIFGTVTFIVWLVLRPQLPRFRVDSFTVSNLTVGNNSLISFTSEIRLIAENPNKKMKLTYDRIDAMMLYRSDLLSETAVTPFSQGTKNVTSVTANFAQVGSFVDRSVVNGIDRERGNGNVNFNFRMLSRVRFETKGWRTRRRFMRVYCGDLLVGFPGNGRSGSLTGGNQNRCSVAV